MRFCLSLIFLLSLTSALQAQLFSPGELSRAHRKYLDGYTKCLKCHTGNRKTACLKCHTDIANKIKSKSGYHYLNDKTRCYKCHGEHKGKKHDLRDLKRIGFTHKDTGWPLEGKHKNLKCEKCHTAKRVNAVTGKLTKKTTYLKNDKKCESCHPNPHKPRHKKECEACHNAQDWNYFDFAKQPSIKIKPKEEKPSSAKPSQDKAPPSKAANKTSTTKASSKENSKNINRKPSKIDLMDQLDAIEDSQP